MEWWNHLYSWLSANAQWVALFVFLISALEAVAVVGIAVPGIAILFGLTFIAGKEGLDFWTIFGSGVAGAMLGDGLSFWIGKYFQHRVEAIWPFRTHPQWLAQGEAFFEKHGGKSIIIGRFVGPLRTFVPLCAGILNMPGWRFTWMNFLSALAWAPFHIFPGYLIGSAVNNPLMPGKKQLWFLLGLVLLIVVITRIALLFHEILDPWLQKHVAKLPSRRLISVNHRPEQQLGALLISLLCVIGFSLLSLSLNTPFIQQIDHSLATELNQLRQPFLDYVFVALSVFGYTKPMIAFGGFLIFYFLGRNEYGAALHGFIVGVVCLVLVPLTKEGLEAIRPLTVMHPNDNFTYPSTHAVSAIMMWGYIGIVLSRALPSSQVMRPLAAACALIVFTSVARLYLGVHWLSDVVGGLLLGGGLLALIRYAYYRFSQSALAAKELSLVILAAFVIITSAMVVPEMDRALHSYEPLKPHLTRKPEVHKKKKSEHGATSHPPAGKNPGESKTPAPDTSPESIPVTTLKTGT